jgi:chitosanase
MAMPCTRPLFLAAIFVLSLGADALATSAKATIQELTSIFENSTPVLQYTFVANIGDQRGYTFGFVGFTSGTYSGTMFLEEYQKLEQGNPLVRFLPAFRAIDAGPHDSAGRNPSTAGLDDFPTAFQACGGDPKFRSAQKLLVDRLSWNPAIQLAHQLGAHRNITLGELYDAYVNHGEDGVRQLVAKTNRLCHAGGGQKISELKWLKTFLAVRIATLAADPTWVHAVDRITVYQTLLAEKNYTLRLPLSVDCYGNHFDLQ